MPVLSKIVVTSHYSLLRLLPVLCAYPLAADRHCCPVSVHCHHLCVPSACAVLRDLCRTKEPMPRSAARGRTCACLCDCSLGTARLLGPTFHSPGHALSEASVPGHSGSPVKPRVASSLLPRISFSQLRRVTNATRHRRRRERGTEHRLSSWGQIPASPL